MTTNCDLSSAIPRDTSMQILSYLSPEEVCRAGSVSKAWQSLTNQEIIWKIFAQRLGLSLSESKSSKTVVMEFLRKECTISTKEELLEKIESFFKENVLSIVIQAGSKPLPKRAIALKYCSDSCPKSFLYACISDAKEIPLSTFDAANVFSEAAVILTIKGKNTADFGIDHEEGTVYSKEISGNPPTNRGFTAVLINPEFKTKVSEIISRSR